MKISALFLLILAGCGSGGGGDAPPPDNNHGYGFAYDVQGAAGLKLRYTPVLTATAPMADPSLLENIYSQVETCMGVQAPAPFVIIVSDGALGNRSDGVPLTGLEIPNPSLILLYGNMNPSAARHEDIHYLLEASTGDNDAGHKSPFFRSRSAGGCDQ